MSKALIISEDSWTQIRNHIMAEYPKSVLLIREKMIAVLGFVDRIHREWIPFPHNNDIGGYVTKIHLDFYSDQKRTMFLLKYSELIKRDTVIDR